MTKIDIVPDEIKAVYRTSFQLSPYAFLNVAARAQKWIDQAISRNMYLADREISTMVDVYTEAWRMGVKTTYYLHMMPGTPPSRAPCASTRRPIALRQHCPVGPLVTASGPRAVAPTPAATRAVTPVIAPVVAVAPELVLEVVDGAACPVDPQERLQCDSCQ